MRSLVIKPVLRRNGRLSQRCDALSDLTDGEAGGMPVERVGLGRPAAVPTGPVYAYDGLTSTIVEV